MQFLNKKYLRVMITGFSFGYARRLCYERKKEKGEKEHSADIMYG